MTRQPLETDQPYDRKSTKPLAATEKTRVSSNALKHGLTGREIVLPGEKHKDYEAFRVGLVHSLAPRGDLENILADKVIIDAWRIRRIPILEAALYRRGRHDLAIGDARQVVRQLQAAETSAMLSSMAGIRKPTKVREEAEVELQQAQAEQQERFEFDPVLDATRVLESSADTFANLWRQERALTRSMHRTLHELQRLQAVRAGEHVPAPAVVDVDLETIQSPVPAPIRD